MEAQPKDEIIQRIKDRVSTTYDQWTIGITTDGSPHREMHKFRGSWRKWLTESTEDAAAIEQYFIDRGMKSDTERSPEAALYVYIF